MNTMDGGYSAVDIDIAGNGGQQHLHSPSSTMPPLPLLPPPEETALATFPAVPNLPKNISTKNKAEEPLGPQPQKKMKSASTGKRDPKLEYDGVKLPEDVDARRKLRNKLSAKVHRKRKQDALDSAKREVEECDDTIKALKSQLTALVAGNPDLDLSEFFDDLEKSSDDEEDEELDDNDDDTSKPRRRCWDDLVPKSENLVHDSLGAKPEMRPQNGSNPPAPEDTMPKKPGIKQDLSVASILLDMKTLPDQAWSSHAALAASGKKMRKARAVAPVINGMDLPTAPDEESRKLRRLMRNRENARKSRERKKREMKKYTARRTRKQAQISKMRLILNAAAESEGRQRTQTDAISQV